MSTVFILRDHVQAFLDATDDAAKLAAYQTIVKNASVDINDEDNPGPRISIFLEDLGHVYSKKTLSSSGGGSSLAELKKLFDAYMKGDKVVISVDPVNNPAFKSVPPMGSGQQDSDEYLRQSITSALPSPFPQFTIKDIQTIYCVTDNNIFNKPSEAGTETSNLIVGIPDNEWIKNKSSTIKMINLLENYTSFYTPPVEEQPNTSDIKCKDDIIAEVEITNKDGTKSKVRKPTTQSRKIKQSIKIDPTNKYMLVSIRIIKNDPSKPLNPTAKMKFEGKITIATSFYISDKGEFNATSGTKYNLLGFIAHHGSPTATGGHYVYFKKFANDKWVRISDDSMTASMTETEALAMSGYTDGVQPKDFLYIKDSEQATYFAKEKTYNGFQNSTGSLCYMNSMNQLLVSMPEFVEYIQKLI